VNQPASTCRRIGDGGPGHAEGRRQKLVPAV